MHILLNKILSIVHIICKDVYKRNTCVVEYWKNNIDQVTHYVQNISDKMLLSSVLNRARLGQPDHGENQAKRVNLENLVLKDWTGRKEMWVHLDRDYPALRGISDHPGL